ncbi:MAG: hypothetical protein JSR89_17100 [Proteobacteria bacterium]|nr:hypothetical protein [Pseudomonadota bacterium]
MTLADIKQQSDAWCAAFDEHVAKTNGPEDVSYEDNRRFDELFDEAAAIEGRLAALDGAKARRELAGFRFVLENIRASGRSPGEIRQLWAAFSA